MEKVKLPAISPLRNKEVIQPYTFELESDRNTLMCTKNAYMS